VFCVFGWVVGRGKKLGFRIGSNFAGSNNLATVKQKQRSGVINAHSLTNI